MSEETKKIEQITEDEKAAEQSEVSDAELEKVAGGKSYYESHSNVAV